MKELATFVFILLALIWATLVVRDAFVWLEKKTSTPEKEVIFHSGPRGPVYTLYVKNPEAFKKARSSKCICTEEKDLVGGAP